MTRTTAEVDELGSRLDELLGLVAAGETVEITDHGRPVALLTPPRPPRRTFGQDVGRLVVPEDFDDPLPDDLLDRFEHRDAAMSSGRRPGQPCRRATDGGPGAP